MEGTPARQGEVLGGTLEEGERLVEMRACCSALQKLCKLPLPNERTRLAR